MSKALAEGIDLLSLSTEQELPGFWNKVMMPMAYLGISMQYPTRLVNDPNSPVAIANGQFILLRREAYDIVGGYARPDMRNTLLDDRDLARNIKRMVFVCNSWMGANWYAFVCTLHCARPGEAGA